MTSRTIHSGSSTLSTVNAKQVSVAFPYSSQFCSNIIVYAEGAIFAINPPSESAFKDASNRAISGDILFGGDPVTSFPPVTTAPVPPTSVSTSDTPSATAAATSARSATPSGSSSNSTGDSPKKDDDGNGAIYVDAGKAVVLAAVMGLIGVMGTF